MKGTKLVHHVNCDQKPDGLRREIACIQISHRGISLTYWLAQLRHCAGDHLYRMNYQDFVNKHRTSGADITVAALPAAEKEAQAFGLMKIDGSGRITDFAEKPKGDALKAMQVDTTVLGLDAER